VFNFYFPAAEFYKIRSKEDGRHRMLRLSLLVWCAILSFIILFIRHTRTFLSCSQRRRRRRSTSVSSRS